MNREDIIRMAREAGIKNDCDGIWCDADQLIAFAALVAAAERERIIAANRPEIEKINAYIKELEEAMPPKILRAIRAERQRIVNLLMIQHEAAKGAHNYWHVAAQLIQADVASDT